jgi:hypothetical protein
MSGGLIQIDIVSVQCKFHPVLQNILHVASGSQLYKCFLRDWLMLYVTTELIVVMLLHSDTCIWHSDRIIHVI